MNQLILPTIIFLTTLTTIFILTETLPQFGATKIKPKTKKYKNLIKTPLGNLNQNPLKTLYEYFKPIKNKNPKIIKNIKINKQQFDTKNLKQNQIQITWFGHSTTLLQSNKTTILTDPIFSKKASPFQFIGPKQFKYKHKINPKTLPIIDYIIISHDHYDHLDYNTIKQLNHQTKNFIVPKGIKNHLIKWNISKNKIKELTWWETIENKTKKLTLTLTPTRHFSGRKLTDRNKTLWGSWSIKIENKKIFFSGDGGFSNEYKKIGNKLGPFDLTLLENGAYSKFWPNVHMFPNQTLQTHINLQGNQLLPIHWGKFDLSLHKWTEPITKLINLGKEKNQKILTPKIGQTFQLNKHNTFKNWWEK